MKLKATLGLALAAVLSFAPLAAHAASFKDPGALPIDEILQSEEAYTGGAQRVYDSGQIFDATEEGNLEKILSEISESYGIEFVVEYVRTFPSTDSQTWSAKRYEQLGVDQLNGPAVYLNISVENREFWVNANQNFWESASETEVDRAIKDYAAPNFKEERWLRGMAVLSEDLARVYYDLPLFDTTTTVPENQLVAPVPTVTDTPSEGDPRTPEERAEDMAKAQKILDDIRAGKDPDVVTSDGSGQKTSPRVESNVDNGAILAGFLWVLGGILLLGVFIGVIVAISKFIQSATAKKRYALKALEDKRLQRLVDQLVPRLRHSDDFLNAANDEERLKVAEKASFAVFGLKAVDKDAVLKMASDYVHKEKESGLAPSADAIDSTELMNLSIKALAEKNNPSK